MTKLLLSTLIALPLYASILTADITAPCVGGTYGHVTFTNCATTLAYADEVPNNPMFVPSAMFFSSMPDFSTPSQTYVSLNRGVSLTSTTATQFINSTITADFTMDPGWITTSLGYVIVADSDGGNAVSDWYIVTSSPYPASSGTISVYKHIETDALCATCGGGSSGQVGAGWLVFNVAAQSAPEPGTLLMIVGGLILVWFAERQRTRAGELVTAEARRSVLPLPADLTFASTVARFPR
jgi:hypothetical protein